MTTCEQSTEKRKKEKKATMVTCLTICSPKIAQYLALLCSCLKRLGSYKESIIQ